MQFLSVMKNWIVRESKSRILSSPESRVITEGKRSLNDIISADSESSDKESGS
jgi:hypothetical protein